MLLLFVLVPPQGFSRTGHVSRISERTRATFPGRILERARPTVGAHAFGDVFLLLLEEIEIKLSDALFDFSALIIGASLAPRKASITACRQRF
jgi:hypothetical protein